MFRQGYEAKHNATQTNLFQGNVVQTQPNILDPTSITNNINYQRHSIRTMTQTQPFIIQFIKESETTNSHEEKNILVSNLTIKPHETTLKTIMEGYKNLNLFSILRVVFNQCIGNELKQDTSTIIANDILFALFRRTTFNLKDVKNMILDKVEITLSDDPEYILDFKLYNMTGLPILTVANPPPLIGPYISQDLGPASSFQPFYTDSNSDSTSEGPPPLEDNPPYLSDSLTISDSTEKTTTRTSTDEPVAPPTIQIVQFSQSTETEDKDTDGTTSHTNQIKTKFCIICFSPNPQGLPFCSECWSERKLSRPQHRKKQKISTTTQNNHELTIPLCLICNKQSDSVFIHGNTGHISTCYTCSRKLFKSCKGRCPICNQISDRYIKIFT